MIQTKKNKMLLYRDIITTKLINIVFPLYYDTSLNFTDLYTLQHILATLYEK